MRDSITGVAIGFAIAIFLGMLIALLVFSM
jgi:ABC-type nitrate/sulfonate/bicarbonate transport system permease component